MHKSYLSLFLRNTGLLRDIDKFRYNFIRLKNSIANRRFKSQHPELKIPPDYYLYETYRLNYEQYINDGLETTKALIDMLIPYIDVHDVEKVLDWGCGPGRITRLQKLWA